MLKKISIYLIGLLPLGLIAGPFVGELILFLIFLIFLFFLIKEKPFYLFQSKIFKIFFLFWAYIVFVSLFAVENLISLKSSFFYIRFGLYTLAIIYFLISYENHLKILYTIYKYTLLFLIIDSSYQIFTGKDFFGLSPSDKELRRISGPFGDKQVLGSFIQKILPVFIKVAKKDTLLSTNDVIGTNKCIISVCKSKYKDKIILLSVIDNLIKGGSGQAVQNMNLRFGFKESEGIQ